jgi:hypothetical protein
MDGRRVTRAAANEKGWLPVPTVGKHRYLFLLPNDRAHRRELLRLLRWESQPYPKRIEQVDGMSA